MKVSRLKPKVILWWGIGLTVGGALLVILLPNIGYAIAQYGNDSSSAGVQSIMVGFETVIRVIGIVMPPLGAALIGSSAVMAYVRQVLHPTPEMFIVPPSRLRPSCRESSSLVNGDSSTKNWLLHSRSVQRIACVKFDGTIRLRLDIP